MKHVFAPVPVPLLASLLIFVTLGGAVARSAGVVDNSQCFKAFIGSIQAEAVAP
ncbi:MAG: hypothetical protein ACOYM3_33765 [Terrimicrobiaceae bacterium]